MKEPRAKDAGNRGHAPGDLGVFPGKLHENKRVRGRGCCPCGKAFRSSGQRTCLECHAVMMRGWRKAHPLVDDARRRAVARAYLNVYVKRGKVVKKACEVCGDVKVQGHHADYKKPLEVRWLCKAHHLEVHGKKLGGGA